MIPFRGVRELVAATVVGRVERRFLSLAHHPIEPRIGNSTCPQQAAQKEPVEEPEQGTDGDKQQSHARQCQKTVKGVEQAGRGIQQQQCNADHKHQGD